MSITTKNKGTEADLGMLKYIWANLSISGNTEIYPGILKLNPDKDKLGTINPCRKELIAV